MAQPNVPTWRGWPIAAATAAIFALDISVPTGFAVWPAYLVPLAWGCRTGKRWAPVVLPAVFTALLVVGPFAAPGRLVRLDVAVANRVLGAVVLWGVALVAARRWWDPPATAALARLQAALLDQVHNAVIATDPAGQIVFWNRHAERMYGWRADEVLGRNIVDVTVPAGRRPAAAEILGSVGRGGTWEGELVVRRKDGTEFPAHVVDAPLRGPTGEVTGYVGVSADISDLKRLEAEVAAELARLDQLYRTAPVGLCEFDRDLRYVRVNDRQAAMTGVPAGAHPGRTLAEVAPDAAPAVEPLLRRVVETGETVADAEVRGITRADPGVVHTWQVTFAAMFAEDGTVRGVSAAVVDVTAFRRIERELAEKTHQLQALSRRLMEVQEAERRHLARELHGEIGQQLGVALLHLRMAAPAAGEAARGPLREAEAVTRDTLDRVRGMSLNLRPSVLDDLGLCPALEWYVRRQADAARLAGRVTCRLPEGPLPGDLAVTCFRIVQEAVTNIVRHAAAREFGVYVWAEGGRLHLSVRDDGAGFDPAAARRRAAAGESTGLLGMQERAELAGGELRVVSAPGRGTTVRAGFPLAGGDGP